MDVSSISVGLIIYPVAFIDVAVNMDELPMSMCAIVTPLALIAGTIRPHLLTVPISKASYPLAGVRRTCLERIGGPLFPLCLGVVLVML